MAAVMLGGASAPESAAGDTAQEPISALPPLDLNFVSAAVEDTGWPDWGETFSSLDDLVQRIVSRLQPGQKLRRLTLAAYSADHTSGFVSFDVGFGGKERIDGLNHTPIKPDVAAKLARLKTLMDRAGLLELRVCGMGQGEHGLRALQALADIVDVPVRGPVDKAATLAPARGLVLDWMTVFPSGWGLVPVRTSWLESSGDSVRAVEAAYAPIAGEPARALPPPELEPGEVHFVTAGASGWTPGAKPVTGVTDLVDQAVAHAEPLRRVILTALATTPYDGFLAFDQAEGESIDGSIREEPGYPHLQVMFPHVRAELERLRSNLAPSSVLEIRAPRFASGESGRRAMQALADALGIEVRAAAMGTGELRGTGGLITRWRSVYPSSTGLQVVESAWREISKPISEGTWVATEAAGHAPIRGVQPLLPIHHERGAEGAPMDAAAVEAGGDSGLVLSVVCANCRRTLEEPFSTPMKVRTPCPSCGSRARRQELGPARSRAGALSKLFGMIRGS